MVISKDIWRDVLEVLKKHKISYTTHLETRDVRRPVDMSEITVYDTHIQINLIVPDRFDDLKSESDHKCHLGVRACFDYPNSCYKCPKPFV